MGDWDFLHEMRERGFSPTETADAAISGAAPWEWESISTEWIDSQLEEQQDDAYSIEPDQCFQSREGFPFSVLDQADIFNDLVDCASRHFDNTGRYLQIWGELGDQFQAKLFERIELKGLLGKFLKGRFKDAEGSGS